jgi:hypothetical protein
VSLEDSTVQDDLGAVPLASVEARYRSCDLWFSHFANVRFPLKQSQPNVGDVRSSCDVPKT